ncbi:hypothetical protein U472_00150 [Orenia metallireducens]|jgi:NADPH-dependent 2,4-dienoyl-CoA reductase/sulfur reductase-like enzyme|uniref:FAD/NAD(P)-binding domain-containing protein n=1 Tax=Orenia metallireducens TaxID=1413210 RepID=A0A1C0ADK5_9FIRM|nr:FAD-dependent oxidoreductase [Orenia metallireducens]OCL28764.1 hypothetical protein U472_00150 [Orenia metallireducens]
MSKAINKDDLFNKLVLATEATPIVSQIQGIDKENIFTVRNVTSGDKIKEFVVKEKPKQVINFLDHHMTIRIEDYLRKKGVNLILEDSIAKIKGDNKIKSIVTKLGQEIETEMLIVAIGVKPNVRLGEEIGINLGESGAIKVNRRMENNLKDIYAVGDCVESYSLITGQGIYRPLGTVANKMGRIAGDQLTGGNLTFRGVLGTEIVKLFDLAIGYTELSEKEAIKLGYEVEVIYNIKPNQSKYFSESSNMTIKAIAD